MSGVTLGFIGIGIILIAYVSEQVSGLQKRAAALSRLEAKLDMLLKNAGLIYDPYTNLPPLVAEALGRGDKIQAIKFYRQATEAGLRQAKEFIEEVQRRSSTLA
jgi:hypothetical protein